MGRPRRRLCEGGADVAGERRPVAERWRARVAVELGDRVPAQIVEGRDAGDDVEVAVEVEVQHHRERLGRGEVELVGAVAEPGGRRAVDPVAVDVAADPEGLQAEGRDVLDRIVVEPDALHVPAADRTRGRVRGQPHVGREAAVREEHRPADREVALGVAREHGRGDRRGRQAEQRERRQAGAREQARGGRDGELRHVVSPDRV